MTDESLIELADALAKAVEELFLRNDKVDAALAEYRKARGEKP